MNGFITELNRRFRQGDVCLQFIYVNVGVFLVLTIATIVLRLFNGGDIPFMHYLEFPADSWKALTQPWSLLTYMFLHADIFHLLFNMLWLYWFGKLFLYGYSARHFRGLYLLGGIVGALFYLLAYNLFPYLQPMVGHSWLMGASASVLAIVVATAIYMPDYRLSFLLIGNIRLKYVALIVILCDLLFITSANAGGHIAHLGGALAGWCFAYGIRSGRYDATAWINHLWDFLSRWSIPSASIPKKPRMKVHYGGKHGSDYDYNARRKAETDEIDRILDKVKRSGYEGLTTEEKKKLFDASKR